MRFLLIIFVLLALVSCFRGGGEGEIGVLDTHYPIVLDLDEREQLASEKRMREQVRWYRVYWGGITVGDVYTAILPTKEGYGMKMHVRSRGIAKLVSRWKSDSAAIMRLNTIPEYESIRFKTVFSLRGKERRIDIRWDEDNKVINETNNPPENRHKRPAVVDHLKEATYDPLTAILAIRSEVKRSIVNNKSGFKVPLYDGRRRTDLAFEIHGADDKGNIHVSFSEVPVAGYTNNELEAIAKRKSKVHVFLSPRDFLPLYGKGESMIGNAYIKFKQECVSLEACMKQS